MGIAPGDELEIDDPLDIRSSNSLHQVVRDEISAARAEALIVQCQVHLRILRPFRSNRGIALKMYENGHERHENKA